jgi:hypothetical protein
MVSTDGVLLHPTKDGGVVPPFDLGLVAAAAEVPDRVDPETRPPTCAPSGPEESSRPGASSV